MTLATEAAVQAAQQRMDLVLEQERVQINPPPPFEPKNRSKSLAGLVVAG